LGSAYKRKAEFFYRLSQLDPGKKDDHIARSADALKMAKDFYYGGYDADDSNHWAAMQYLSIKAILGESLENEEASGMLYHILPIKKNRKQRKPKKMLTRYGHGEHWQNCTC
jgi:hypothetical protein